MRRCQLCIHLINRVSMSLSLEMKSQAYNRVLTQLAKNYEIVIRNNKLGVQLTMKVIGEILWRTSLTSVCQAKTYIY